ncbi:MAG TPA: multidrug effflux MFS transporter [Casimicrobiaceae bacterium]|nr:multidrug effflux MFS transporter [Casimicrobiaceae bacterium]
MTDSRPSSSGDSRWSLAALIASLGMLGPFAIDAYLPAFGAIGATYDVPPIAVQQTLSIYLIAYAFMMLWHGALSDAFGRRAVVLGSLVVFAVATFGCAVAANLESLLLFRVIQGLSAGAPMVVGRALIRDRYHGAEAQKLMSQVTLIFGIAPAVAPVAGGILLNLVGWRSIFVLLLVLTLALIAWSVKALPETLPRDARQPLYPRVMWRNYRNVGTRLDFLLLALIPALNFSGFFLYIAAAPRFLVDLIGVSTYGFAWLFVPMIAGIMLGAVFSGRLAGRLSARRTVEFGFAFAFAGAALNFLIIAFVPPSVPWHVLPLFVYSIGSAVIMPSVTLMLLDLFPATRGLAASLQGFIHFSIAAVNAGTIAPLLSESLATLAAGMAAFIASSLALWIAYRRRSARPFEGA